MNIALTRPAPPPGFAGRRHGCSECIGCRGIAGHTQGGRLGKRPIGPQGVEAVLGLYGAHGKFVTGAPSAVIEAASRNRISLAPGIRPFSINPVPQCARKRPLQPALRSGHVGTRPVAASQWHCHSQQYDYSPKPQSQPADSWKRLPLACTIYAGSLHDHI